MKPIYLLKLLSNGAETFSQPITIRAYHNRDHAVEDSRRPCWHCKSLFAIEEVWLYDHVRYGETIDKD